MKWEGSRSVLVVTRFARIPCSEALPLCGVRFVLKLAQFVVVCLLCHLPKSGDISRVSPNCSFYEPPSEGGDKSQIKGCCWRFQVSLLAHSSRPGLENGPMTLKMTLSCIGAPRLTMSESLWKRSSALNVCWPSFKRGNLGQSQCYLYVLE